MLTHPLPELLCQKEIVPVVPANVKLPGEFPEQTELVPLIVPATGDGFTVIKAALEFAEAQAPL